MYIIDIIHIKISTFHGHGQCARTHAHLILYVCGRDDCVP